MQMTFAVQDISGLADRLAILDYLVDVFPNAERVARFILAFDGQTVYLDVPDDLTPEQIAQIEQVVTAHQP